MCIWTYLNNTYIFFFIKVMMLGVKMDSDCEVRT